MKQVLKQVVMGVIGAALFIGGFFIGMHSGGIELAKSYDKKVKTDLYVQEQMDYIFSGLEKCHVYVEDKKKKEAEDAAKEQKE